MNNMKHFMFASLALVLLLSCITVGPANAQGVYGKFTLPCATHWGGATLPAGDYFFTVDGRRGSMLLGTGRKNLGFVIAQSVTAEASHASSLLVERTGGVASVTELRLAGSGLVLRYSPPKAARKTIEELTRIPIAAPGE
jgi:hypothetical protein